MVHYIPNIQIYCTYQCHYIACILYLTQSCLAGSGFTLEGLDGWAVEAAAAICCWCLLKETNRIYYYSCCHGSRQSSITQNLLNAALSADCYPQQVATHSHTPLSPLPTPLCVSETFGCPTISSISYTTYSQYNVLIVQQYVSCKYPSQLATCKLLGIKQKTGITHTQYIPIIQLMNVKRGWVHSYTL